MTDAVFVLGLSNHIVDLNPAAENILGQPAAGLIGQPAEKVFAACPQLMTFEHDEFEVSSEITLGVSASSYHYELSMSPVRNERSHIEG